MLTKTDIGEKVVLKVSIVKIQVQWTVIFFWKDPTVFIPAVLGYATTVIPRWFTYYASSALFAVFGIKMLKEGYFVFIDLFLLCICWTKSVAKCFEMMLNLWNASFKIYCWKIVNVRKNLIMICYMDNNMLCTCTFNDILYWTWF